MIWYCRRALHSALYNWLDKAIGVQRFFSAKQRDYRPCCPPLSIRQYAERRARAAKRRCLPKISDLKREDFFVFRVEERSNAGVLRVMRQTKRGNIPFQEPLYPDCFFYSII